MVRVQQLAEQQGPCLDAHRRLSSASATHRGTMAVFHSAAGAAAAMIAALHADQARHNA